MKEANTSKHTAPAKGRRLRRALLLALLAAVLAAGGLAFLFHREITGGGAAGRTVTVTVEQGSGVAAIAAPHTSGTAGENGSPPPAADRRQWRPPRCPAPP